MEVECPSPAPTFDDDGLSEAPEIQPLDLEQYRVQGLAESAYYIREFISESEEELLMSRARGAPRGTWTALRGRRAAQWGRMPGVRAAALPWWLAMVGARMAARTGLPPPDHALVNEYGPGEGILPHEDGPRFLPNVATISTGSSTVLRLWARGSQESHAVVAAGGLFLEPRSLVVLRGELYTHHLHSIECCTHDPLSPDTLRNLALCAPATAARPPGTLVPRGTRLSFTLRTVNRNKRTT